MKFTKHTHTYTLSFAR